MRRIIDLQTEAKSLGQHQENMASLLEQSQASFDTMRGLKRISDRAGELATLADGTRSDDELALYAVEVTQLIKEAVGLANTKFRGDYLLAGTRSNQKPFDLATSPEGIVTGVSYRGNESVASTEIAPDMMLSVQVLGANTTGSGPRGLLVDSRFGADFFNHLIQLQDHLLAGDANAIASTDLAQLQADEENLLIHFGNTGALQAQLQSVTKISKARSDTVEGLISKEADADLAETLVRLTQTQNAYTAALQSGARILSTTLLDYLR
jgi:flagellar hook-associated protein 3 FlgL